MAPALPTTAVASLTTPAAPSPTRLELPMLIMARLMELNLQRDQPIPLIQLLQLYLTLPLNQKTLEVVLLL